MGAGMKLVNSVLREVERSAKANARERARHEREQERRGKQIERERIQQEKEDERLRIRLAKEDIKAEKERIKKALEMEIKFFEKRVDARRKLRLDFINKINN